MKNLTGIILIAVVSLSCFSQTKNFIDQNYIEVTGKAEIEIVPDEIYLRILLNEKDFKGKKSLEVIENAMIEKLEEMGFDVSKDLAVKDMASNFKNYWIKASEIYSIKEYQLLVKDAKTAGSVFRELESMEISNITIEKVEHSEIQKFKEQVKVSAIVAAKQKAESMSEAINQSCGKAIYIQELNNKVYYGAQGYAAASNIVIRGISSLSESSAPEIEFEKIKLEYSILVRFALN